MANVFRWTGHFPEKTRSLVRHLAKRAEALKQVYAREAEDEAVVAVTTLVTSLAMNFVHRGAYFPEAPPSAAEAAEPPPKAVEPLVETPEGSSEPPAPAESLPPTRAGMPAVEQRKEQLPSEREELKRASR
jgi:hypothetical protein